MVSAMTKGSPIRLASRDLGRRCPLLRCLFRVSIKKARQCGSSGRQSISPLALWLGDHTSPEQRFYRGTPHAAINTAFVPPNAKEFDMTVRSGMPIRARPAT
jgi:hypothetical protein